ncbi:MAG: response regulator [Nitrospirae bacterium]|nr:response regulator [Nitrospirota bacterium]
MKIFIIDDELCIRAALSIYFSIEGHTTITASSVKEAEAIIERETFDAALVDFCIRDRKGTEIVRLIKEKRPDAEIIGMSGTEQGRTFNLAGADAFIRKPFNNKEILELINGK